MENNLSCEEVIELLFEYYDNELSSHLRDNIRRHLDSCSKCRQKYEDIQIIFQLIKNSSENFNEDTIGNINFIPGEIAKETINQLNNHNPITCNEVLEQLGAYIDDELDLKLHYLITEHLESCINCKNELLKLKNLSNLIKTSGNTKQLELEEDFILAQKIRPSISTKDIETCNYTSENLSAYLDKELPKDEMLKISEHLMYCRYCRRDYENLKETKQALHNYFNKFENTIVSDDYSKAFIIARKVRNSYKKTYAGLAVAAVMCISMLTWFSINFLEPSIIKNVFNEEEFHNDNDVIYVNAQRAEDHFLQTACIIPDKNFLPVLYEN